MKKNTKMLFSQEEMWNISTAAKWIPKIKKTIMKKKEIESFSIKGVLILLVILMPSCLTVGMIERNCDKFEKICLTEQIIKETVRTDTLWQTRDTIIYIPIKGDTVFKESLVYIKDGLVQSDTLTASVQFADAFAWVFNSNLNLNLIQKEQEIEQAIGLREKTISELREQLRERTVVVEEGFWQKFKKYIWHYVVISILILYIIDQRIKYKEK